jgi:hypothetical protein
MKSRHFGRIYLYGSISHVIAPVSNTRLAICIGGAGKKRRGVVGAEASLAGEKRLGGIVPSAQDIAAHALKHVNLSIRRYLHMKCFSPAAQAY